MNSISTKWSKRFLNLAHEVASWSKDESSKVGAVIVDEKGRPKSFGFNGFPMGVNDDVKERHERPEKYLWFEHAERNAIYLAKQNLDDCILFVTHFTCPDCARAVIQSGIKYVFVDKANGLNSDFWERNKHGYSVTRAMYKEANVGYYEISRE